jgi:hypothetical protein
MRSRIGKRRCDFQSTYARARSAGGLIRPRTHTLDPKMNWLLLGVLRPLDAPNRLRVGAPVRIELL